jgi:putative FmdB family regulatory protein
MPIYEYACKDCQTKFEMIRPIKDADAPIHCTQCDSQHVSRAISLFNAASEGRSLSGSSGCGSCAGGSCSSCGSR